MAVWPGGGRNALVPEMAWMSAADSDISEAPPASAPVSFSSKNRERASI